MGPIRPIGPILLLTIALGSSAGAQARWQATVSQAGSVQFAADGRELGALGAGLFEATWRYAGMGPAIGAVTGPGPRTATITAPGGAVVDSKATITAEAGGLSLRYTLTPRSAVKLNSIHVSLGTPASALAGTEYTFNGQAATFPAQLSDVRLRSGPCTELVLRPKGAAPLTLRFGSETPVLLQDDRQWGDTISVRIGPDLDGAQAWPAGKSLDLSFAMTAQGGIAVEYDGPTTIEAGLDWVPLDLELDIEKGSALDFSAIVPWHAPAGALGRVVAGPNGSMAFQKVPDKPVRFYGANLCFSAHYITHEQSERLAERLLRLGYNAMRVHHYESELVDRSGGTSVKLNPEKLDQLDYLLHALKRRGIYVTTDLFVSRPVFAAEVWPGENGDVGMDEFKMAVPVNDRAYTNYAAFARALLGHVNPYTKMKYADDPALAWLSLINEGNPGNFINQLTPRLARDYVREWNAWLVLRYGSAQAVSSALGGFGGGADPKSGAIPLPLDGAPAQAVVALNLFLADNQEAFVARCRSLMAELGCRAMLTNLNAWTNPLQMQAVRAGFDYVDDHFYVDHPEFIEQPWRLPSRCPNTSPVAAGASGGRGLAFTRMLGMPYTNSEFNYSGPGRYRGVGGILTGALGAIQDWSVIWRFGYSHSRDNLFQPGTAGYFDMATDPLSQAADRASVCLFRRGDIRPAPHSVAIAMTRDDVLGQPTTARPIVPSWNWLAWVTRTGSTVVKDPSTARADMLLPVVRKASPNAYKNALDLDPYAPDAGAKILAAMRDRNWLKADNRTNPDGPVFQSETGEVTVDGPQDRLTLDTPRTAGGYARAGQTVETRLARITVRDTDATVWVSSVDGNPINGSRRLLITHLTDLQNTSARYGDKGRRVLLDWGRLPHLVRTGRATVAVTVSGAARARVYGLSTSGKRLGEVAAKTEMGRLVVPLSIDAEGKARMLYEVVIGE